MPAQRHGFMAPQPYNIKCPFIQIQNMRGLRLSSLNACTELAGWLAHGWLGSDAPASECKEEDEWYIYSGCSSHMTGDQ
jgi:hypothetical protein